MTHQEIIKQTIEERERLVQAHLNSLPMDTAIDIAEITERIEALEQEYKLFLARLWKDECPEDERGLEDILDKQYNRFALDRDYQSKIVEAQAAAEEVTLWEKMTNSNYKDITQLNALIVAYAKDLLAHMTRDFMEDVVRI